MANDAYAFHKDGAPLTVTGATQANPCVVTAVGHGLSTGDVVVPKQLGGMTELNANEYTVTVLDADTVQLAVDSRPMGKYTGGGSLLPRIKVSVLNLGKAQGGQVVAAVLCRVDSTGAIVPVSDASPAPMKDTGEQPWQDKQAGVIYTGSKTAGPLVPSKDLLTTVTTNAETNITEDPAAGSLLRVALRSLMLFSVTAQEVTVKTRGGNQILTTIAVPAGTSLAPLQFLEPVLASAVEAAITITSDNATPALEVLARYELQTS